MSAPEVVALLGEQLRKWDDRTLDYAVSHLYGAWPENENLDRDAFINELLWYIKHRDERGDELPHVAAVLDAHYADRERAAAEKALRDAAWDIVRGAGLLNPPSGDHPAVAWLRGRADTYRRTDKEADRG